MLFLVMEAIVAVIDQSTEPNESPTGADAPELVQEYVDSGGQALRSDPRRGVLRGVKLLGLQSRNGRRYAESALRQAIGLYEGSKVNVNHPTRDPLSPRDYRDRLGVVRNARFEAGKGLFGDLHYNPKHALAEQLAWDAEHSPQNVGLSHNVLARTRRDGGETVVEAITRVQSVDLVADPATTAGLFEAESVPRQESTSAELLEANERLRSELSQVQEQLARQQRRAHVDALLRQAGLDDSEQISEALLRQLMAAEEADVEPAVEAWASEQRAARAASAPESRERPALAMTEATHPVTSADFVEAISRPRR